MRLAISLFCPGSVKLIEGTFFAVVWCNWGPGTTKCAVVLQTMLRQVIYG
jgi:hypothetical protein